MNNMLNHNQLPLILLARAVGLWFRQRVRFMKECIEDIEHGDEENFIVFRKVIVDPLGGQPDMPGAIFRVQFRFTRFSVKTNQALSLIPIPFIIAQSGFRSKTWMSGLKTGAFMGVYEWDSVEDAENYLTSFPLKLMRSRAVADTLTHEIIAI
ncbi:MAG: hypothetical protein JRF49_00670 [Deltaproteobacteria bacterium]|nr:hypothetical protein [Deltaproteobacteria bacterium]